MQQFWLLGVNENRKYAYKLGRCRNFIGDTLFASYTAIQVQMKKDI
jgi:hypothetical protein